MAIDGPRVVSTHPPYIPITLSIRGQSGALELEALVDTGFDGDVVVPPAAIATDTASTKDLVWYQADGSAVRAPGYVGELRIGSTRVAPIIVSALGNLPIIGRGITSRFTVTFDHDRRVIVEP